MEATWQRVGAYALVQDDAGRLLLTRFAAPGHSDDGSWTLPGGGMEWGEDPEQTVVREVHEETGLVVVLGPVLGVRSEWYTASRAVRGEPGHVIRIVFRAAGASGDLRTAWDDDDSTIDARWFTSEEVAALRRVELVDWAVDRLAGSN